MVRVAVPLMLVCACRWHFDAIAIDGSSDAAPPADAAVAQPVMELNTTFDEDDASLTGDMLEIYFDSNRSGTIRIWRATRMTPEAQWDPPAIIPEIMGATGSDATPTVSADGLTLYFSSTRNGNQNFFVSQRPTRGDMWSMPVEDVSLSGTGVDIHASVSQDRLRIYFASARGGPPLDLFTATRALPTDTWPTPTRITELNTGGQEADPWVSADERTLVFASDRDYPQRDIYMATRAAVGDMFGVPVPLAECNTVDYEDSGPWLSPNLKTVVFSSNRAGTADIYIVKR